MSGAGDRRGVRFLHPKGLALGATAIASPNLDQPNADATVEAAWQSGIRYFDTAPMYQGGRSEIMLGRALRPYPRGEYLLSSKAGRLVRRDEPELQGEGRLWRYDFSRDGVLRSVEESLDRLGQDHLDIVYIHDPDSFFEQAATDAFGALTSLRDSGTIGAIGVGITQAPVLERFLLRVDLDAVLLAGRYSLIDNEGAEAVLPLCRAQGVTVVLAQTMHGGLVDGRHPPDFHYRPTPPDVRERVSRILEVCNTFQVAIAAVAFQFVLANEDVDMVLTGPANPAQLRENVQWSRTPIPSELWTTLATQGLIPDEALGPGNPGRASRPKGEEI
jgi:D-threo-aldose 1-dehydrogenase